MFSPVPFPLFHNDFLRILSGVVKLMSTSQEKWSEPETCSESCYAHSRAESEIINCHSQRISVPEA